MFCSDACRSLYRRYGSRPAEGAAAPPEDGSGGQAGAGEATAELARDIRDRRLELLGLLLGAIREDGIRLCDPSGRVVGVHPAVEPARRLLSDLERAQPSERVVHRLEADEDPVLAALEED